MRRPTADGMRRFLAQQQSAAFTYSEVGGTTGQMPGGYAINHARQRVGWGLANYHAACDALRSWEQLRLGWVDCWPADQPLMAGANFVVIGQALGLYWLNACRIAYVTDETTSEKMSFGYAHGTLPGHLAIGEERFLVEMDRREEVTIDIVSFSKPSDWVARLGSPLIRSSQRRFVRHSASHICDIVRLATPSAVATLEQKQRTVACLNSSNA